MLTNRFMSLRNFTFFNKCLYQLTNFSAKPPNQPIVKIVDGEQKKVKRHIPKITLLSSDDQISVTTLEEAQHLSKRRDLKLVKLIDLDSKTQRPVYKLMTGAQYHAEELKQKEKKKAQKQTDNTVKGEKLLMINASISQHDLEINVNKIIKWLTKRNEVRVTISGNSSSNEKLETIYKFLEEHTKDRAKLLQKRVKGGDLKFQIMPIREAHDDASRKTTL